MPNDNPKYKDRLFNFIFGLQQHKAETLSQSDALDNTRRFMIYS